MGQSVQPAAKDSRALCCTHPKLADELGDLVEGCPLRLPPQLERRTHHTPLAVLHNFKLKIIFNDSCKFYSQADGSRQ